MRVRASERVVWLTRGIGWARTQGKLDEAAPYYEQSLAINKKVYGEEHPSVATDLNALALLLWRLGRYADAIPYQEEAVEIKRVRGDADLEEFQEELGGLREGKDYPYAS